MSKKFFLVLSAGSEDIHRQGFSSFPFYSFDPSVKPEVLDSFVGERSYDKTQLANDPTLNKDQSSIKPYTHRIFPSSLGRVDRSLEQHIITDIIASRLDLIPSRAVNSTIRSAKSGKFAIRPGRFLETVEDRKKGGGNSSVKEAG